MKLNERSVAHYATCDSPADHTGFLCKRVERHHHTISYQRRWFILKGNLLFYFEERESRDPLGLIVLEGCTVELCEAAEEFAFAIHFDGSGAKAYVLVADCQMAMEAWVKALSRASFDYMRLVVKELEKQLEEARKNLVVSHKFPKKSSSGRKRHLSNPTMVPVQEHPAITENGYATWGDGQSLGAGVSFDHDGGYLKPPPLPPRRRPAGSSMGGVLPAGLASTAQESPVSPETACFSKLHDWYGQEIADVRREWLESQKKVEM
ncbi:sesquipedalian-2 [Sphaerodactylus townsendi]|uniref:sesquipedalian-2 n=1 Tax=Sphaerodactylus townsendi TaxID=933632 RepID=UPI002026DA7C|nr:sesquipedalian-2 [Sphaerodactylus townsendi]XP_048358429.1 sesquipedalian-2 [Sphaerodactylus townsendi]XP_048358430.1 sesquipedalian-2 [Sphaerodactylus townsendi]